MTRLSSVILLGVLVLGGCKPGDDNRPITQQQRDTLEKAKKIDALQQQEAEKQRLEAEKQAQ